MEHLLLWNGRAWLRKKVTSEPWFGEYFRRPDDRVAPPPADWLEAAADALRPRPAVLAVLAPGVWRWAFSPFIGLDCFIESLAAGQRHGWERGYCMAPEAGRASAGGGWLWVALSDYSAALPLRAVMSTLHHEVWHVARPVIGAHRALAAHAAAVQSADAAAPLYQRAPSAWLSDPEEAEAWSYERWAMGTEPPHGVRPGWRVRRLFRRVREGRLPR